MVTINDMFTSIITVELSSEQLAELNRGYQVDETHHIDEDDKCIIHILPPSAIRVVRASSH